MCKPFQHLHPLKLSSTHFAASLFFPLLVPIHLPSGCIKLWQPGHADLTSLAANLFSPLSWPRSRNMPWHYPYHLGFYTQLNALLMALPPPPSSWAIKRWVLFLSISLCILYPICCPSLNLCSLANADGAHDIKWGEQS